MLFTKSAVPLAVLALCNVVVAAQPPACLLSVMGDQPNPADLKMICVKNADKVQDALSKECDDSKGEALKHFASTCSLNGYKVDSSSTSDSTASATTAGSHSTTTGFSSTTTAKNAESTSGSGSGSGSGSSSSASSTSNSTSSSPSASSPVSAGASDRHVSAAAFAAVVFVGFAATM